MLGLKILLGLGIELTTVITSAVVLPFIAVCQSLMDKAEEGYRFSFEKTLSDKKETKNNMNQSKKTPKYVLGLCMYLIPGVNLIYALVQNSKIRDLFKSEENQSYFVPLTEDEQVVYNKLDKTTDKIYFCCSIASKKEGSEEILGVMGGKVVMVDHELQTLHEDPLLPLDYTLDEVKELNGITKYSYRLGMIDDKAVAIIGIPNEDTNIGRVQLKNEDYRITHDFVSLTEEEAQDKTFIVYPFMSSEDTKKDLDKCIERIRRSRGSADTSVDLKSLIPDEVLEQSTMDNDTKESQEGFTYKKER